MNRFLINLRALDDESSVITHSQRLSQFSSVLFRIPDTFIGNIGESLEYGAQPTDEDVDANVNVIGEPDGADETTTLGPTKIDEESEEPIAGPLAVN